MALTEDQRAMLQLLLQSGQSYEDIGSLLGNDVDEVRARARAAFLEMGGEDPDAEVSLTDYLLGQADPIGRADAARHLQSDPDANALATKLAAQLRLIAPGADLPEIPAPREKRGGASAPAAAAGAGAASAAKAAPKTPRFGPSAGDGGATSTGASMTSSQKRLIGALGGGAVVVLIIVLFVTGVFGGGSDNSSDNPTTATTGDTTSSSTTASNQTPANSKVVGAVLSPVGDTDPDAQGSAVFGQIKKTPVLQVVVKNIEPTADGENYSIWLYRSDKAAFRLSGVRVGKDRGIAAQLPVPSQVLRFISNGTFNKIDISLTQDAELKAEAAKDKKAKKLTLNHLGETVMQGTIAGPGISTGTTGATGATP